MAQQAVQLTRGRNPDFLGTLAAAYAEAGRFPEAIRTAEQAISLASAYGDAAMAESLREQLKFYRASHPYRELDNRSLR